MKILVVGGGSMGQSFVRGLIDSPESHEVCVVEHNSRNANDCIDLGVSVCETVQEASQRFEYTENDVCVIAVKPIDVAQVAVDIAENISSKILVVSIAAGISLASLADTLKDFPLVRAMPNIAASQQLSATAMSCWGLSEHQEIRAREVLEALGTVVRVDEEHMNVVTAVSGSGPAYFFMLAQYLAEAAQEFGLGAEIAHKLVVQTLLGSAALVDGNGSFGILRNQVTSPGGTTQAAMETFDNAHLKEIIKAGVKAAETRAAELDSSE